MTMTRINQLPCAPLVMAVALSGLGWAQPAPSTPCGPPGSFEAPRGLSISIDKSSGRARYRLDSGKLHIERPFPGVMEEVVQSCRIPGGRILVFGKEETFFNIEILDAANGKISDSLGGYTPALSPDKGWIVARKFYPLHGVNASEEYLLYDLAKDREANRAGIPPRDTDAFGRVIYPIVLNAEPYPNVWLSADQTHVFRSKSFYWEDNSAAFLFADSVEYKGLSLVLVYTKQAGQRAWVHSVAPEDVCTGPDAADVPIYTLTLSEARIMELPGGLLVRASFSSTDPRCAPRALELAPGEFTPAKLEVPGRPQPPVLEQQ